MVRKLGLVAMVVLMAAPPVLAGVAVGISVQAVPGVWVGTGWTWLPQPPPATNVAVVKIGVHPWWTRLELDGRFIGIADDFDGVPDYLYLKPGTYRLECKLGGYETQVVEIVAKAGYRYDIDFRLERVPGTKKEHFWQKPHRPKPLPRLYGPVKGKEPLIRKVPEPRGAAAPRGSGPDLSLRPDLQPVHKKNSESGPAAAKPEMAHLALTVAPPNAAVYLDGEFLATGKALAQLEEPVAIAPGHHTIEVMAPGRPRLQKVIEAAPGETVELTLDVGAVATVPGS